MRRLLLLAVILGGASPAFAQQPSTSYTITIESPGSVATGDMALRVRVTGGVRDPEGAAYHLRTSGAWSEAQSVRLSRSGADLFEDGIPTAELPNDAYRIEVRVWSDVPPYDPTDPRTYARTILDVAIDNPPQAPQGVQALSPATALRVGWRTVPDADRSDFLGYRVFLRKGRTCPAELTAYNQVAEVDDLLYADEKLRPGDYCLRVAAVRVSAVTEAILSAPSAAVKVSIAKGNDPMVQGGSIVFETTEAATPPPPPALGEGETITSDGEFIEDLPYGSQTVTQEAEGVAAEAAVAHEAGVDPRRTPTLIAGALILVTFAGQLRRFLRAAPKR
jgi:hypothetical protein